MLQKKGHFRGQIAFRNGDEEKDGEGRQRKSGENILGVREYDMGSSSSAADFDRRT